MELIEARHSVRQYSDQPIEAEKRAVLDAYVRKLNEESGLRIQMVYEEPKCFSSMLAHYGTFSGVNNYIAIVGKNEEGTDEKAGYYGEALVLKAQEIGLNTCWVALTHGKVQADVRAGEKMFIVIAIGYGMTQGNVHRNKDIAKLAELKDDDPQWYRDGVRAALLAPTAINQQKFHIERAGDKARIIAKTGIGVKLDLGIVKYHFEAVSGRQTI